MSKPEVRDESGDGSRDGSRDESGDESLSSLVGTILDEEQRRLEGGDPDAEVVVDDLLPGVGDDPVSLREAVGRGGWGILAVFTFVEFMETVERSIMSVLAPDIQATFDISDTTLGAIAGATGALMVLGSTPMGVLADRLHRMRLAGIATGVWTIFLVASAFVANSFQLFVAKMGIGLGQANTIPIHEPVLADTYPIAARGRIFAVHRLATPVGGVLGPLIVGGLAVLIGGTEAWRGVVIIVAIPAALAGLATFFLKDPGRGRNEQLSVLGEELATRRALPIALSAAAERLRRIRTYNHVLMGFSVIGFNLFSVPLLMSLHLEEEFGLGALDRGVVFSLSQIGAVVALPIAGIYADRILRVTPERLVFLGAGGMLINGCFAVLAIHMRSEALLTLAMVVANAGSLVAFVTLSPIVTAVTPYRLRSQGAALIGVFMFLFGAFGGLILGGLLSDAFSERVALTVIVPPASIVGAVLISLGSRYVRSDLRLVVEELREEQSEVRRLSQDDAEVPVLQIRNLDFSYGAVQVLFDVDLDVHRGEVVALVGTNGAGKSTLLRVISGLGTPQRGVVRLNGLTLTFSTAELRYREGIVQVRGGHGVIPDLTVDENLEIFLTTESSRAEIDRRKQRVYDTFPGLADVPKKRAGDLSGGQQQMLAVSIALVSEPEILLIDELSLGLAPVVVEDLLAVVERLKADGVTILIVEQSLNVAAAIADRAVFMEKGRIRFDGPTRDLLSRDDLARAVFFRESAEDL